MQILFQFGDFTSKSETSEDVLRKGQPFCKETLSLKMTLCPLFGGSAVVNIERMGQSYPHGHFGVHLMELDGCPFKPKLSPI